MTDIARLHRLALDATGQVVAAIEPGQMGLSTPCDGWDVRALLNHVVSGNQWAGELARGRTIEEVGDRFDGDLVGDDPAGAYGRSAKVAAEVFEAPGALDAPCAVSYGPVPGSVYAGHRFMDVFVHGWDLAKATGQDTTLDPELVEAYIEVVEPQLDWMRSAGAFAGDVEVPPVAAPQTRLLTLLGRQP
jgi:uncharacterized protein (TIGR03086 family)